MMQFSLPPVAVTLLAMAGTRLTFRVRRRIKLRVLRTPGQTKR